MEEVLEHKKALDYIKGYYDVLSKEGYVKKNTERMFLRYLFLIDFVDTVYYYLTDEDYKVIEDCLHNWFSNGECLLPYPLFCHRCTTVGMTTVFDYDGIRVMNTEKKIRITD